MLATNKIRGPITPGLHERLEFLWLQLAGSENEADDRETEKIHELLANTHKLPASLVVSPR
jgi:hypothetical protein